MNENYYTERELAKVVGYDTVPTDRQQTNPDGELGIAGYPEHWNGEQQLNKSTGEVEVYHNGDWCVK
jgi:hypothetical protein